MNAFKNYSILCAIAYKGSLGVSVRFRVIIMSVRFRVILTFEKQTSECQLSKETKTMHILQMVQMVQEQHAIYFGYTFFRHFGLILQES